MTSAIAIRDSGLTWSTDYESITSDSRKIQDARLQKRNYLKGSAADWFPTVEAALGNIQNDCGSANWDGYGALPIKDQTIQLAKSVAETLFVILPRGTPVPDLIPEADGEICLSWSINSDCLFSLSIGAHHKINFAGQFGRKGGLHGWLPMDTTNRDDLKETLQEMAHHIGRLYGAANGSWTP